MPTRAATTRASPPAPTPRRTRALVVAAALLAAAAGCGDSAGEHRCDATRAPVVPGDPSGPCNGAVALCDRRYDQVVYVTAHNAMSNADDGWYRPNQQHGVG